MYRISQGRIFYGTGCGGEKEKEAVEAILWECTSELRELYEKARWGNGQKWLMIDLMKIKEKCLRMYFSLLKFVGDN